MGLKMHVDLARPPVLVGEDNPYGGGPQNALLPEPANSAGWRLCHKVMQMDERIYKTVFLRYNLCARKWNIAEAKRRARGLSDLYADNHMILLGAKVSGAFGLIYRPFNVSTEAGGRKILILPHPSGRCRVWGEPGAYDAALRLVKEVLGAE